MSMEFDGFGASFTRALLTNWPTKVTALVLATLLWAVVEAEQPTTQLVPVRLALDLPTGQTLAEPLPAIQALYAGPASEIIKLYATPPVIHRQLVDSVTVIDLSPGDITVVRDVNANAQDIQPRRFTVRLRPRLVATGTPDVPPPLTDDIVERVLMGVPVILPGRLRNLRADPPAVAVTVRGPAARLRHLTRDSLAVGVPDRATTPGTWVRVAVTTPPGITATATPDSIRVSEPTRG